MDKKRIRYLVMDVDGTLTDGKIYIGASGEMMKAFSIKDGYGLKDVLGKTEIRPVIITGRSSAIVEKRCQELGIDLVFQGIHDKAKQLKAVTQELDRVAYIGDDLNDLSCIRLIKEAGGAVGCPSDAVEGVRALADFIAPHKGGEGAVRDFIDWLAVD